jgi:NAD(P)-dependent dehydrogenase (short-subunit alcohol dehydrogenase family)
VDRVVVITGTSSGIGLGAAVELAKRGQRVFATMRDTSRAGPLRAALQQAQVDAAVLPLDVTDEMSVQRAITAVLDEAGRIDVLVNNAGVTEVGPLEFTSDADIKRVFEANVFGAIRTVRTVLPSMRSARRGRIVNVSSNAAHPRLGVRLWGLYGVSKAALHALSLELVKELSPIGIEVVLLESGVGGLTAAWERPFAATSRFEGGAYAYCERVSAAQIQAATAGPDSLPMAVQLVADACTAEVVPVRFRGDDQAWLDVADRIPDDVFLAAARGDADPSLYAGLPGFWPLDRQLKTGETPAFAR